MTKLTVRDFIYVDIERLKSILSQIEEGFTDSTETSQGSSYGGSGSGKVGIPFLAEGKVEAEVKLQRQISETKSLHDYLYNKIEAILLQQGKILEIPNREYTHYSEDLRNSIGQASFVLIRGMVNINDFSLLREFIESYGELAKFLACCGLQDQQFKSLKEKTTAINKNVKEMEGSLDENLRKGFLLFFDLFYKDRVVIKTMPYNENSNFRFVGNINKSFLRDDISSIIYKYGTAPVSEWTIFGQIASIPPEDRSHENVEMQGSNIEDGLQVVFNVYRGIELMAQSVKHPEIAITPIAIYRE